MKIPRFFGCTTVALVVVLVGKTAAGIPGFNRLYKNELPTRFAAALAGTDLLLTQRNEDLKQELTPAGYWWARFAGNTFSDPSTPSRRTNPAVEQICSHYDEQAENLIESFGLDVNKFNTFGSKVAHDPLLHRRVLQEAQLFKLSSQLDDAVKKEFPVLGVASLAKSLRPQQMYMKYVKEPLTVYAYPYSLGETQRFALCLDALERARLQLRRYLKTQLRVSELPQDMCSPDSLVAMAPRVQEVCAQFPATARDIILNYGFTMAQFSRLHTGKFRRPWNQWSLRWNLRKIRKAVA